jgi:hypothetical protein
MPVILDGGGSTAGGQPNRKIPGSAAPWHFCCSLDMLQMVDGEYLPDLPPIPHLEGVNGALGPGQPGTALEKARAKGRVVIPHSFRVQAWGAEVGGYLTRSEGTGGDYYHDVWHRPHIVGTRVFWDFDAAGWLDFRRRALRFLFENLGISEVPERFKALAERGIREEIASLQGRTDPASQARVESLRARLPQPDGASTEAVTE